MVDSELIIANVWIVGSFLMKDTITSLIMLLIASFWLIMSLLSMSLERKYRYLKLRMSVENIQQMHELTDKVDKLTLLVSQSKLSKRIK